VSNSASMAFVLHRISVEAVSVKTSYAELKMSK